MIETKSNICIKKKTKTKKDQKVSIFLLWHIKNQIRKGLQAPMFL